MLPPYLVQMAPNTSIAVCIIQLSCRTEKAEYDGAEYNGLYESGVFQKKHHTWRGLYGLELLSHAHV